MMFARISRKAQRPLAAMIVTLTSVAATAAMFPNSAGFVNVIGSSTPENGSYSVDVAWQVYDGTSPTDPLGANSSPQLVFALEHKGSGGVGQYTLSFGKFTVFAPLGGSYIQDDTTPTAIEPAGPFLVGPAGHQIDAYGGVAPFEYGAVTDPVAQGIFTFLGDDLGPSFAAGQHSQLLVLTPAVPASAFGDMWIEFSDTNTINDVPADVIIHVSPAPSALLLLGLGGVMIRARRRIT